MQLICWVRASHVKFSRFRRTTPTIWNHECARVFRDRLIDETDRKKFNDLNHTILEHYAITDQELETYQNILFGDVESAEKDYIKLSE